jgi:hypothetical protein
VTSLAPHPILSRRSSGVLLHLTSLPGRYGSGSLGDEARHFLDWLVTARQSLWQILPVTPPGAGDSPYQSVSAFAGSPWLVDLDDLARCGWLEWDDLPWFPRDHADFARVLPWRMANLRRAWSGFQVRGADADRRALAAFAGEHADWLDDYCLFMTLESLHGGPWTAWPTAYARRDPLALARLRQSHAAEIGFWQFVQWRFHAQWQRLRQQAHGRGIRLVGDLPIFVAHHSADVWAHTDLFQLDAAGEPLVVAGVPPDYFSETGQRWGNPLYRWDVMAGNGYRWWKRRLAHLLSLVPSPSCSPAGAAPACAISPTVRAKPAVHFGGKFRIIDFALSNCINSGMRRIGVITQYKSHSLLRHLQRGWSFLRNEMGEFVDLLPAQQRMDEESLVPRHGRRGVPEPGHHPQLHPAGLHRVLAGDHIYKMDYSIMLADHVESGGACTVGCIEVPREEAKGFGVMAIDEQRHITAFVEKPADPPPMPGNPDLSLASMGIYVFSADYLYRLLEEDAKNPDSSHDFGKDLIPRAVAEHQALAHPFTLSAIAPRPSPALLARRRHGGRLLGGQPRPRLDHARAEHVRQGLADLDLPGAAAAGQVRARRGRPPRRGDQRAGVGRLHRVGLDGAPVGAVLQRAGALLQHDRAGGGAARRADQPPLPAEEGGHRPRCVIPEGTGDRRGRPRRWRRWACPVRCSIWRVWSFTVRCRS